MIDSKTADTEKEIPKPGKSLEVDLLGSFKVPFDDVYILGGEINEGTFATVFEGYHQSNTKVTFAIKLIERNNDEVAKKALYEANILHDLQSVPNVVKLIDYYMDPDFLYIVQELAKDGDLFDHLASGNTYTENCARETARILLQTIDHIHQHRIVHRDLKPENLLLKDKRQNASILLCDFGGSKKLPIDEKEGLTTYIGTLAYMAPEIIHGHKYREKVDAWSIGCITYLLLCGFYPFGDDNDPDLEDNIVHGDYSLADEEWDLVSGSAKRVVKKLLIVTPKKRWSASEALQSKWFKSEKSKHLKQIKLQGSLERHKNRVAHRRLKAAAMAARIAVSSKLKAQSKRNIDDKNDSSDNSIPPKNPLVAKQYEVEDHTESTLLHDITENSENWEESVGNIETN